MKLNSKIQMFVNAHKSVFENWREGEPVKVWEQKGIQCIKYESGNWWHYRNRNNHIEWW